MSHAVTDAPDEGSAASQAKSKKAKLSEGKKAERRLGWLLCAPAAIVMLAVTGYPIVYSIWLSLQRYDLRFPGEQEFVGFDNYIAVLTNSYWWTAFGTTMLITVVTVAIEFVLGMALALVMHRTLVGRGLVRTVALIPYGIVTVAAAFSWYYAWTPETGYLANLLAEGGAPLTEYGPSLLIIALAEVWKTTPFMALLLMAGLALVPDDLMRAASMDGANAWQRFTKVMLPVMKPAILVAVLFRTLDAFRIFDNIFVLTGGSNDTSSVSMQTYNNLIKGLNLGIGSAMAVLIFLTVALIAFVFVKGFGTAAPGSDDGGKR
ncbi:MULTISPECIES: carbohydrate ABC transporter permease [Prauserella salsuginis group]|uniref:Multiple sugar transport system permease protein n=2 Tax=Prauserella salsuginis group TaxID=2893672 RepID=A0A839XPJ4_9PSEU|nr:MULTISPECIES: sugar ABC transporter permease [Prauserella salsuginis group]MBB3661855.1 multiple sugar transport system permease protein [Prauserella sediminis]MCR3722769.1 multiple sugar transport system permease protein [Prauserella flava]MCR3737176.1 multiple sugar transport system permease protein [Prauserella salsuginis]